MTIRERLKGSSFCFSNDVCCGQLGIARAVRILYYLTHIFLYKNMIDRDFIKKTFLDLIKIDSPSGHEGRVADFILEKLKENKVNASRDKHGNIVGKIAGHGNPIILSAHMDTVEPGRNIKAFLEGGVIRSVGDTILGADDKAGITEILAVIMAVRKYKYRCRPLEIIFTVEEETGINGVNKLNFNKINSREALVIDASGPPETIVIASPFIYLIDIKIRGKAAHAGNNPEKGINSIQVAADAIRSIKIGRIDQNTTNNIGVIRGGEIRNGVPALTMVHAEARSHDISKAKHQVEKYKEAFLKSAKKYKAKIDFKCSLACSGFSYSKSDFFVRRLSMEWEKNNRKVYFKRSGGASDANGFVAKGIKAIPIGYGGKNPHSVNENVSLNDMERIAKFILGFINDTSG